MDQRGAVRAAGGDAVRVSDGVCGICDADGADACTDGSTRGAGVLCAARRAGDCEWVDGIGSGEGCAGGFARCCERAAYARLTANQ